MMVRLSLLVLIVASVSSAQAQFKSLIVEEVDNKGSVPGRTYRVYAQMEAEGDVIDAVFGDGQDYLEITSTAPFYQHEMGGNSANELQRADVFTIDGLKYDSWVTIGYEDNYMNALTAFLMDFTEFEQGGKLYTNNGAWFVTPDMRQAAAGPDGKLLLMQLTTEGEVRGVINLHGRTRPLPLRDDAQRAMYPDSLVPRLIDQRNIELSIR
jgi:hypothetical protein